MLGAILFIASPAKASQSYLVNGTTYTFPDVDDLDWGQNVTDWAGGVSNGTLQKTGGLFSLSNEAYFGARYGLKTHYVRSENTIVASSGPLRFGTTDYLAWRNNSNSADLQLGINSLDQLTYRGIPISTIPSGSNAIDTSSSTQVKTGSFQASTGIFTYLQASSANISNLSVSTGNFGYFQTSSGTIINVQITTITWPDGSISTASTTGGINNLTSNNTWSGQNNFTKAVTISSGLFVSTSTDYQTTTPGLSFEVGGKNAGFNTSWDGSIPSFTTTTALPATIDMPGVVSANGYIYVVGGSANFSSQVQKTVFTANINGDGTILQWSSATALPTATWAPGVTIGRGYIYVIAGFDGANGTQLVYYNSIGSSGTVNGAWKSATILPTNRTSVQAIYYNGYVYTLGGAQGGGPGNQSTVYYAKQGANGSLTSWNTATSLPAPRIYGSVLASNGYLYYFGGDNGPVSNAIYYARVNTDGSLGQWQTQTTVLPDNLEQTCTIMENGYLYVIGGANSTTPQSNVYSAKMNLDGSIGSFATQSNLMSARGAYGCTEVNGYIYLLGGRNSGLTTISSVTYTTTARIRMNANLDMMGISSNTLGTQGSNASSLYTNNANVRNNLNVGGASTMYGGAGIVGNTLVTGDLDVGGSLTCNGGNCSGGAATASLNMLQDGSFKNTVSSIEVLGSDLLARYYTSSTTLRVDLSTVNTNITNLNSSTGTMTTRENSIANTTGTWVNGVKVASIQFTGSGQSVAFNGSTATVTITAGGAGSSNPSLVVSSQVSGNYSSPISSITVLTSTGGPNININTSSMTVDLSSVPVVNRTANWSAGQIYNVQASTFNQGLVVKSSFNANGLVMPTDLHLDTGFTRNEGDLLVVYSTGFVTTRSLQNVAQTTSSNTFTSPQTVNSSMTVTSSMTVQGAFFITGSTFIAYCSSCNVGGVNVSPSSITLLGPNPVTVQVNGASQGGISVLNFGNNLTATVTGSTVNISATSSGSGGSVLGISSNGVNDVVVSTLNFTGDLAVQYMSGGSSATIKVDFSTLTTRIGNLDGSTATLTTRANNLDTSTAAITIRASNLDASTATLTTRINNLDSSTATITTRENNLDTSTTALTSRASNLDTSTAAITTRANNLDISTAALTTRANSTASSTGTYVNGVLITSMNFTGAGVSTAFNGSTVTVTINGSGSSAAGAIVVQNGTSGGYSSAISSMSATGAVVFDIRSGSVNVSVDLSTLNTKTSNLDTSTAALNALILGLSSGSASGGGGGVKSLFLNSTFDTSNTSNYYLMLTTPSPNAESVHTATFSSANGMVMISSHSTLSGGLGQFVNKIPAGYWQFIMYAGVDSVVGQTNLIVNVATMSRTGTNLFQIMAATFTNINTLNPSQYTAEAILISDVLTSTDDRVQVNIYGITTSALNRLVTLTIEGTARASRIGTTVERQPTFISLNDTPQSYAGSVGQFPMVNNTASGMGFVDIGTTAMTSAGQSTGVAVTNLTAAVSLATFTLNSIIGTVDGLQHIVSSNITKSNLALTTVTVGGITSTGPAVFLNNVTISSSIQVSGEANIITTTTIMFPAQPNYSSAPVIMVTASTDTAGIWWPPAISSVTNIAIWQIDFETGTQILSDPNIVFRVKSSTSGDTGTLMFVASICTTAITDPPAANLFTNPIVFNSTFTASTVTGGIRSANRVVATGWAAAINQSKGPVYIAINRDTATQTSTQYEGSQPWALLITRAVAKQFQ